MLGRLRGQYEKIGHGVGRKTGNCMQLMRTFFTGIHRLKHLGHVLRTDDSRMVKKLYKRIRDELQPRERPKDRWIENVMIRIDLKQLRINVYLTQDRDW